MAPAAAEKVVDSINPLRWTPASMDSFVCGFAYGTTTVVVGQPFDTIKTRMQAFDGKASLVTTARTIWQAEGVRGLYRGGLPLVAGGALMRAAQFGVYELVLGKLRERYGPTPAAQRLFGVFDPQVVVAGFAGGVSRGIVEGPFEYIKVRRQVEQRWRFSEILNGSSATIFRNSFLFSSFVVYMDLVKQLVPGGLSPFALGAVCSNLAWLTIWPLDVVKSQQQSGNYAGKSYLRLVADVASSGALFRGVVPGLLRSTIANGFSMVAYKRTEAFLTQERAALADAARR